jgi:diguanylate cyclase (GGDEF)-like protein
VKKALFLLLGLAAIAASYAAATFGIADGAGFDAPTLARIAFPALVSALVVILYFYYRARLRSTQGTVNELNAQLIRKEIEIDHLSAIDELTGLATRRAFDESLREEYQRSARHQRSLALMLLEIDDLVTIGERIGRLGKGFLLSEIAGMLHNTVRVNDLAARFSDDTLALLLPETTEQQARALGEKLRTQVRANTFLATRYDVTATLTLTLGFAALETSNSATAEDFVEAAELALYAAKRDRTNATAVPDAETRTDRAAA